MLKDRQELREFREECVRAYNAYKRKILVCAGTGCVSSGSLNIYARLRELISSAVSIIPESWLSMSFIEDTYRSAL